MINLHDLAFKKGMAMVVKESEGISMQITVTQDNL